MHYKILRAEKTEDLEDMVNKALSNGYELAGGINVDRYVGKITPMGDLLHFYQAVVKK